MTVLLLLATLGLQAPPATQPVAASCAFLAGHWVTEADARGDVVHEIWSASDNVLVGVSHTIRGGRTTFFEFLRIVPKKDGLYYVAMPGGKAGTEFKLTVSDDRQVVFENPAHDFPNKITYARREDGALDVKIEGLRGGQPASQAWVYRKATP